LTLTKDCRERFLNIQENEMKRLVERTPESKATFEGERIDVPFGVMGVQQ